MIKVRGPRWVREKCLARKKGPWEPPDAPEGQLPACLLPLPLYSTGTFILVFFSHLLKNVFAFFLHIGFPSALDGS